MLVVTEEELLSQVESSKEYAISAQEDHPNKQDAHHGGQQERDDTNLKDERAEVENTEGTGGAMEVASSNPAVVIQKQTYSSVPPLRKGETPSLSRTMGNEGKAHAAKTQSDDAAALDHASHEQNMGEQDHDYDDTRAAPPCSREEDASLDKERDATHEVLEQAAAKLEALPNDDDHDDASYAVCLA